MLQALSILDEAIRRVQDPRQSRIDFDFDKISAFIHDKLSKITEQYGCRVLFVAERSSHVWGTSHPQSDNDVKAVVFFEPRRYYSPIRQVRRQWKEVYGPRDKEQKEKQSEHNENEIEPEPDVELNCIEIMKLCELILKNDPNIFEMFTSPIQYHCQCPAMLGRLKEIVHRIYDWHKLAQHYVSWSHANYHQLAHSTKKRLKKKPLKILLYIWRGILSAEWLAAHQQCEGLPLYIPDLIASSAELNDEEKRILMSLLTNRVRKSKYEIDCVESRQMLLRAPEILQSVRANVDRIGTETKWKKKEHRASCAASLEELVYEIIESFE